MTPLLYSGHSARENLLCAKEDTSQEELETLMVGRTSIVIAHRLSTVLKADRILVIHHGVITESGDHETLLAQDGIYRELYKTQFRRVLEYESEAHPPHAPGLDG